MVQISLATAAPGRGPLSTRPSEYQNFISSLPVELLTEIFLWCLPDGQLFVSPDPRQAPLLLCKVCRHWRLVALNTPQLWQSLLVVRHGASDPRFLDLCRLWISRAATFPLSVRLHISDRANADALCRTIADLTPQWRNMDLGQYVSFLPKLTPQEASFPLLERLAITANDSHPCSFMDAPKLREVYVDYIHTSTPLLELPWSQLTTFMADFIDLDRCMAVLSNTPNLVDCTVVLSGNSPDQVPIPPLLHLRSLAISLSFSVSPEDVYTTLIDAITAPVLQHLSLRFARNQFFETPTLFSLVERSQAPLHTLALSNLPSDLIPCLQRTPSLRHLRIELRPDADRAAFFGALQGRKDFLPCLESLRVVLSDVKEPVMIGGPILEMLVSRWSGAAVGVGDVMKLRVFQLVHEQTAEALDEAGSLTERSEYRRLKAEGMELFVGSHGAFVEAFSEPLI